MAASEGHDHGNGAETLARHVLGEGEPHGLPAELRRTAGEAGARFAPHPLGFLRLPLGHSPAGLVYLHCWPGSDHYQQSQDLRVHRHSVDVASLVLLGGLTDRTYRWEAAADGEHRLYAQDLDRPAAGLERTTEVGRLSPGATRPMAAGDRYVVRQADFHETVVDWATLVVTLAVFVDGRPGTPSVVAPADGPERHRYEAPALLPHHGDELLGTILDRLADPEG